MSSSSPPRSPSTSHTLVDETATGTLDERGLQFYQSRQVFMTAPPAARHLDTETFHVRDGAPHVCITSDFWGSYSRPFKVTILGLGAATACGEQIHVRSSLLRFTSSVYSSPGDFRGTSTHISSHKRWRSFSTMVNPRIF